MSLTSDQQASHFLTEERQFHLGFLPTEQSSPLTRHLDAEFARSTVDGVKNLQRVDRNVLAMARNVFAGEPFWKLVDLGERTLRSGGRIVFSGCGATGRLSILLESMFRECCRNDRRLAAYASQVFSIMTGGDYALVRSVEFFEDYQSFGRRQVRDLGLTAADMLVAITEGGETSSVLGTVFEALDVGASAFLLFNNPAEVLAEHLERSRQAIRDPRVTVLDLSCGPMALAGSTRMQATTSEQLVAGGALETIINRLLDQPPLDYAAEFAKLLEDLESPAARQAVAGHIDFEAQTYRRHGLVTYFAADYLLDIFTDTTERSPTFMLPPFRKMDDKVSPRPWAFVKNPCLATPEVWSTEMNRPLRCLEWTLEDYRQLGAPEILLARPPAIRAEELLKFPVGNEMQEDRTVTGKDAAILVTVATGSRNAELAAAFKGLQAPFASRRQLCVGETGGDWNVPCRLEHTPLEMFSHLAIKLVLNTVSTGTMVVLGRVQGNWMSWVDASNKKLIDRSTRLVSELSGLGYEESCRHVFAAMEEIAAWPPGTDRPSPVQLVLRRLK